MRAQEFVSEINAPNELTVPEELVQRFTSAGWQIAGEGRDQIVLDKPNSRYVLKIVGQGSGGRIDMIRQIIDFYRQHQRNPHFPRVGGDRTLRWEGTPYYAYTQEKLKHLPGDEAMLDWLENAMYHVRRGDSLDFSNLPPGLSARQIDGLVDAVDQLFASGLGDENTFDLSNVYNIMQRPNGQLVIVDPFAGWDDDEELDESAVAEGRDVKQQIEEFLDSLSPDDVGVEEFPGYRVHYEGFTDDCKSSVDYQKNPNRVYKQVYKDFIDREGGGKPVKSGMVGDEEYPILYSVFRVPQSKTIDTAEKAYNIAYRKKQPWPRGSREEQLIRSNWQLSGLYDQYVLKQGVTEGKMAELYMDLEDSEISDKQFEKMYGMTRKEAREQFSQTDMWAFPELRDPNKPLHEQGVAENFADGKVKGKSRPGRVKRAGASCDGSVSSLRAKARKYGGEKGKMYHWCANMKGGRKK